VSQSAQSVNDWQPGAKKASEIFRAMLDGGRSFSGRERNCCFLNTRGSKSAVNRFADISALSGLDFPDDGRAVALVDWDHDGDVDLWISNRNAPRLRLLRNELPRSNGYLALRLRGNGTTTNRDAIGARVQVVVKSDEGPSGEVKLINTLRAGEGFLAQSSKWLHFGLGKAQRIEKVVVDWPTSVSESRREEFALLDLNRRYNLVQGTGIASPIDARPKQVAIRATTPELPTAPSSTRIVLLTPLSVPDFEYYDWSRSAVKQQAGTGRPLLVNLFSSTCRPCLQELADLTEHAEAIRSAGVEVLALSVDELEHADTGSTTAREAVQRIGFPFRTGLAPKALVGSLQAFYDHLVRPRPLPLPASFLIDGEGRMTVIYRGKVEVDQVLADAGAKRLHRRERFLAAAALRGHTIESEVIDSTRKTAEAEMRSEYATYLRDSGLVGQAIAEYQSALKLKEDSPQIHLQLGLAHMGENALNKAKHHFARALQLKHDDAQTHHYLGLVSERLGTPAEAAAHFQNAISVKPRLADSHYRLGRIRQQENNLVQAEHHFRQAATLKPGDAGVRNDLGLLLLRADKIAEAEEFFRDAIRIHPRMSEAHNNLGTLLARKGQFKEAVAAFETSLRIRPDDAQTRQNLSTAKQLLDRQR
jgi:Flp pilus assembly protein TadD